MIVMGKAFAVLFTFCVSRRRRKLRHISTIGEKLLSSNMSSTCPHNMMNFGPLTAELGSGVWGTPTNFNWFRVLAALLHDI